jgi:CRP/FNR family transcriptional regulator, cyclic AMP receptor protein
MMIEHSHSNSLDAITLLNPLSASERQELAKHCRWRHFANDEQIIDRQSDSRDVCFVVSGTARVVIYSLSGREISFNDVEKGSFFGEIAALDGHPRSASVVAVTPCLIAFLPPAPFHEMLLKHPALALTLLARLAAMIRTATDRILDLSTVGANNRVHAELLRLALLTHDGKSKHALISPLPVHSEIAARVSTTRETVARVISELTRHQLLVKQGGDLLIRNLALLQQLVEDVRGGE